MCKLELVIVQAHRSVAFNAFYAKQIFSQAIVSSSIYTNGPDRGLPSEYQLVTYNYFTIFVVLFLFSLSCG